MNYPFNSRFKVYFEIPIVEKMKLRSLEQIMQIIRIINGRNMNSYIYHNKESK